MKLSSSTKLMYGMGFTAQGVKDGVFQVFLVFYFIQILGLDAALVGLSTLIVLFFDAITDPLVGVLTDNWKSEKWGRRHPFMLASALPLGLSMYLLFLPPENLGETGLFWWLTIFSIGVRVSLTLFTVPAMSLGAELSDDYDERTSITSYRVMFGAFMSMVTIMIGFAFYFTPPNPETRGLMNIEAYPRYALFCGIVIVVTVLWSTLSTRKEIPRLQAQASLPERFTFKKLGQNLGQMLRLKSFNSLISYTMVIYIGLGIGVFFTTYFLEYYFQFSSEEMLVLPIGSGLGGVLALILAPKIAKLLDKKKTVLLSTLLFGFFFSMPYNFRMLGFFPENGSNRLVWAYLGTLLFAYIFLWIVFSLISSMMADVVDEYELKTQSRDEGLFFSSLSFAYKMTVGLGYLFAGLLLKWIQFPKQTTIENIPQNTIDDLAIVGGPIILGIYLFSMLFILFYPIDKQRYEAIRATLSSKN